jgi:Domain of unknown function (DUF5916)/Carbohydrate family 9 binding domain-like
MKFATTFAMVLLICVQGSAQNGDLSKVVRETVTVPKFAASPVIDGKLDDEIWKQAAVLKDLIQTGPADHVKASKPTEVYIGYDATHLYVAFKCWDERDKIRSSVVQRDGVFGDDHVQFWLDTYNDQRRAYNFAFNPLGIQMDGIQTEGQGTDYNVDVLFESKGVVEDWGWSVEVKVPFKSLRYSAGKGKFWGFNASRTISRLNNEFNSWVALPRGAPGFLNKFGKITGLDEIKAERTLEVIPTFTLKETGTRIVRDPPGTDPTLTRFLNPAIEPDFGFTVKYSISSNITLDAAYNPDFADTEADAPVVEANQRFPIYFSEKRPFFLEGVDIFKTPIEAVYTRRVENPDVAAKLTGKIGKTSFGIFGALDDPLFNQFEKNAYAGVLRVKRDIAKESSLGFLATSYHYPEMHNEVAGFDGKWKIDKQSEFRGQVLGSTSRNFHYDPFTDTREYKTLNGVSYTYQYNYNAKNIGYGFGGNGTTQKFRADMGFTYRTDSMNNFAYLNLSSDPAPKAFIIRKSMGTSFGYRNDFRGRMQGWGYDASGNLSFKGNAGLGAGFYFGPGKIYEDEFGPARSAMNPGTFFGDPSRRTFEYGTFSYFYKEFGKRVSLNADLSTSFNNFDYDFGAGPEFPRVSPPYLAWKAQCALLNIDPCPLPQPALDPGAANSIYFGVGTGLKPTDKFSLSLNYSKSRLKRNATGLLVYDSNNFSFGSAYQFSQYINVKARVYYNTLGGGVFGQYTFAWTPSVGKALYVGYNSSSIYNGHPFGPRHSGYLEMSRTFFIKMSYLFRKSF